MKQLVGPLAVNYEMLLRKGVMSYARCWTADLEDRSPEVVHCEPGYSRRNAVIGWMLKARRAGM